MRVWDAIREDIQTVFDKDPAAKTVWEVVFLYPGLHAVWLHRVAHWLWEQKLLFLGRWVSHVSRWLTGIEIHPGAKIGRRVFIDHGMGVVIGETAEVGEDVLMYQGVVLGGTSLQKTKRHPTIGRNVVIGSGAIVLGPIEVGDGSKIGAGSVVIRAVPAGATVVGVPARMVGRPEPGELKMDLEHAALPDPVVKAIGESLDRTGRLEERVQQLERALAKMETVAMGAMVQVPAVMRDELAACVRDGLKEVIDPETGISVVEMGLIRDVRVEGDQVRVDVLLDNPHCPMVEYLVEQIRRKARAVNGVGEVKVTLLDHQPVNRQTRVGSMQTNVEADSYVG